MAGILDRDSRAAGIAKRDELGRTIDVYATRHTFATLLSKGGVTPRTAQEALRHGSLDLMLDTLPALPLTGGTKKQPLSALATGTDGASDSRREFPTNNTRPLVPLLVQTGVHSGH